MGVARGRCLAAGVVAGVLACVLAVAPSASADVPSVPASGGASQCVPDRSTIAQCFPDKALAQYVAEKLTGGNTGEVLTSQDVNNTTQLDGTIYTLTPYPQIASVQGLQVFTNLDSLNLSGTRVSDVSPLAKLTKLEDLDLSNTRVSDVSPLAGLTHLGEIDRAKLDLSGTQVSDVSPLAKLQNLRELDLSGTRVSDATLSSVAKLMGLHHLHLSDTRVSDVSPLAKLTNLSSLDLSGTRVSDATLSSVAKLMYLGDLDLSNTRVSDVSPLAKLAPGPSSLDLSGTRVSDVSPLAGLTDLETLDLSNTRVSDVSPLAELPWFGDLYLSGTRVSDATLSSVAKLPHLGDLDLSNTRVSDVSPLAKLAPGPSSLDLSGTRVSDVSPLAKLTYLRGLDLSGTRVSDATPLAKLTNLGECQGTARSVRDLDLSNTQVSDVSPLAKLTHLGECCAREYRLDLSNTRVSDVSPLAKLPFLGELDLSGTRVSDATLSSVAKLHLGELDLSNTQVSDVSPLSSLPPSRLDLSGTRVSDATLSSVAKLDPEKLDLSNTRVSDVSPLSKVDLSWLDLSNTRVSDVSPLSKVDLSWLDLSGTQVSDATLSSVAERMDLETLDLSNTRVSDVSPLAKLPFLSELHLSNTQVSDVSPLSSLPLSLLNLSGTRVLDLGVLHGKYLSSGCNASGACGTSFAGVRPSVKLTVDGDGSVSMPAPRWLDGTVVTPSSTSPAGGTLDAKRGVVTWRTYDPKASYSYDFKQSLTVKHDNYTTKDWPSEFSGHVTGVKPKTFTVSFDSAGGRGVASQSVVSGGRAVKPVDPSRSGYVFAGWYTKDGKVFDFNSVVKSDVRLVARWRPVAASVVFRDVSSSTPHASDIAWLADAGVSTGWREPDGSYSFRGMDSVKRQDMAAFLRREASRRGAAGVPAGAGYARFRDVSSSTPHADDIGWLSDANVSTGWREPDGSYSFRGMDPVRRQDMAAFLRREATLMGVPGASSWKPSDKDWKRFRDVTRDTPHAEDVLWLAHAGVSTGYADGTFGGMLPVYRQDMAAFLHRLDNLKK